MSKGTCALCHSLDVELIDSHFMPAALYRIAQAQKNEQAVIVSPGASLFSSAQATDFLLCATCEDRFNKNGESWVLKHCWRSETKFPIYDMLAAATPEPKSEPNF